MAITSQDERLLDLARSIVELIDRALYERCCDLRWWASDAAFLACAAAPDEAAVARAAARMGMILSAYGIYRDIWLCGHDGTVLASGRPDRHPDVGGGDVADEAWFRRALLGHDAGGGPATEVRCDPRLGEALVATCALVLHRDGRIDEPPCGVLAVHVDWAAQAGAVVEGARIAPQDRARTRVLLADADCRVLAASDGRGLLTETLRLDTKGRRSGVVRDAEAGLVTAFHRAPEGEGIGWYGIVVQARA